MQGTELINLFGLVKGTPDEVALYIVCIIAGIAGGLTRVILDNKNDVHKFFNVQNPPTHFFVKLAGSAVVGAIIGFLTYPSLVGAASSGFVFAYSFRYVLGRLNVSQNQYFGWAINGLNSLLINDITRDIKSVEGVRNVQIKDPKDGSGKVFVIIDSVDKPIPADKLEQIDRILDKYDLLGIDYKPVQPELIKVSIVGRLFVTDETQHEVVEEKIKAAIVDHFKNLMVEENVVKNKIVRSAYDSAKTTAFQDFNIVESDPEFNEDGIIDLKEFQVAALHSIEFVRD